MLGSTLTSCNLYGCRAFGPPGIPMGTIPGGCLANKLTTPSGRTLSCQLSPLAQPSGVARKPHPLMKLPVGCRSRITRKRRVSRGTTQHDYWKSHPNLTEAVRFLATVCLIVENARQVMRPARVSINDKRPVIPDKPYFTGSAWPVSDRRGSLGCVR